MGTAQISFMEAFFFSQLKNVFLLEEQFSSGYSLVRDAVINEDLEDFSGNQLELAKKHSSRIKKILRLSHMNTSVSNDEVPDTISIEFKKVLDSTKAVSPERDRALASAVGAIQNKLMTIYEGLVEIARSFNWWYAADLLKKSLQDEKTSADRLQFLCETNSLPATDEHRYYSA
jgi:ferritin-like metal-binding protein YciE